MGSLDKIAKPKKGGALVKIWFLGYQGVESKSIPCHSVEPNAGNEADAADFVQVDLDRMLEGEAHDQKPQAQPFVSIELDDSFEEKGSASLSVGTGAGGAARAGAVQEVVREVAQAAMEHHQATIESLDDELGKPGEEKYLKERLGCAWGIFFFYNFPSFLSKGTKMHK